MSKKEEQMRDWENVIPREIAIKQTAWERAKRYERAVAAGASKKEIAKREGISPAAVWGVMVRQYWKAQRIGSDLSPVEHWMKYGGEIAALAGKLREPPEPPERTIDRQDNAADMREALERLADILVLHYYYETPVPRIGIDHMLGIIREALYEFYPRTEAGVSEARAEYAEAYVSALGGLGTHEAGRGRPRDRGDGDDPQGL